jgi:hypothetical protein
MCNTLVMSRCPILLKLVIPDRKLVQAHNISLLTVAVTLCYFIVHGTFTSDKSVSCCYTKWEFPVPISHSIALMWTGLKCYTQGWCQFSAFHIAHETPCHSMTVIA